MQAEDGIRDLVRSRGLGDVYKRQLLFSVLFPVVKLISSLAFIYNPALQQNRFIRFMVCLLYTSDAADERSSVDLGGRRIIKKKKIIER